MAKSAKQTEHVSGLLPLPTQTEGETFIHQVMEDNGYSVDAETIALRDTRFYEDVRKVPEGEKVRITHITDAVPIINLVTIAFVKQYKIGFKYEVADILMVATGIPKKYVKIRSEILAHIDALVKTAKNNCFDMEEEFGLDSPEYETAVDDCFVQLLVGGEATPKTNKKGVVIGTKVKGAKRIMGSCGALLDAYDGDPAVMYDAGFAVEEDVMKRRKTGNLFLSAAERAEKKRADKNKSNPDPT